MFTSCLLVSIPSQECAFPLLVSIPQASCRRRGVAPLATCLLQRSLLQRSFANAFHVAKRNVVAGYNRLLLRPSAVTHPQALTGFARAASYQSTLTFKSLSINITKKVLKPLLRPSSVASGISCEVYVYIDRHPRNV